MLEKYTQALIAAAILLGVQSFCGPAQAKPGQSLSQVKQWLQNHTFLPPQLVADSSFPGSYYVDRELTNGKVVHFFTWLDKGHVIADELRIDFKAQVGHELDDGLNLFERSNTKAQTFFSTIYDASVAQDFAQSKFIFEGHEYYVLEAHSNQEQKLKHPNKAKIFFGKRYNYLVSLSYPGTYGKANEFSWSVLVYSASNKAPLYRKIQLLKQEERKYLKEESFRQRNQPADLDI